MFKQSIYLAILMVIPQLAQAVPLPEMDCLIEPNMVIELSSSVNGVIDEIFVKRGDKISAGQTLVQLENSVEMANLLLAQAKADYSQDIEAADLQIKYTNTKLQRMAKLYAKKVMSVAEQQDAQNESNIALINKKRAVHARQMAKLELIRAKKALDRLVIKSPVDAIVVEKYLSKGEAVEEKNILQIAEVNPLKVEVIVPAEFFGEIKTGMKAILTPEIKVSSVEAEVTMVDKVIDASSGTFYVRLRLPNPTHSLPGGLKCKVIFDNGESPLQQEMIPLSEYE